MRIPPERERNCRDHCLRTKLLGSNHCRIDAAGRALWKADVERLEKARLRTILIRSDQPLIFALSEHYRGPSCFPDNLATTPTFRSLWRWELLHPDQIGHGGWTNGASLYNWVHRDMRHASGSSLACMRLQQGRLDSNCQNRQEGHGKRDEEGMMNSIDDL